MFRETMLGKTALDLGGYHEIAYSVTVWIRIAGSGGRGEAQDAPTRFQLRTLRA